MGVTLELSDTQARLLQEHLAVTLGDEDPGSDAAILWGLHDDLVKELG